MTHDDQHPADGTPLAPGESNTPALGAQTPPDAPDPGSRYRPATALRDVPADIWRARALVRALSERELRAAYKQAALGMAWAVLSPVALMLVFTLFINRVADVKTYGVPYPLFSYLALIPWGFFSSSLNAGGVSIINQLTLVNKLRCPREVFPLASVATAGFNAVVSIGVLILLFPITSTWPKATTPWALVALPCLFMFTIGVTLMVSAITVYLRDLRHALSIILQLGLLATPVAYSLRAIPEQWRTLYCAANPLGAVIDAFRSAVLYGSAPDWTLLGVGTAAALAWFVAGAKVFRRLQPGFADVA